jgi:hypothetical protein
MKTFSKALILSVMAILLASCNAFAPEPTETPTPTNTSLPTSTHTPEPTSTPTETPTPIPPTETPSSPSLPMPTGKPLSSWENIPIMSGAIAGDENTNNGVTGYSFTIKTSADEIQSFYETELGKLDWSALAVGQGTEKDTVLMIFMKGTAVLSVSIIPQPDGIMYVLIVK